MRGSPRYRSTSRCIAMYVSRNRGCRTTRCSWRSRKRTGAPHGPHGNPAPHTASPRRCANGARRCGRASSAATKSSMCSLHSSIRCARPVQHTASSSWATCRFSLRTIPPMCGPIVRCSNCTTMERSSCRPACRPTISARRANSGAIRSTTGSPWRATAIAGGSIACARRWPCSTWCVSTTSAASRPSGKSPLPTPPPCMVGGCRGRARRSSRRSPRRWGQCQSWPKISV